MVGRFTKSLDLACINYSGIQKIISDTSMARDMFSTHVSQALEASNKINKLMYPYNNMAKLMYPHNNMAKQMSSAMNNVAKFQSNIGWIGSTLNQAIFNTADLSGLINRSQNLAKIIAAIDPQSLSEAIRVYADIDDIQQEESIESVVDEIENNISKSSGSVLSIEFYLNLIIVLFFFVISQNSALESEDRIMGRLEQLEISLTEIYEEAMKKEYSYSLYVVLRAVNLRSKATSKSNILGVMHPNQKVKLIERKSKWIKVEYYDHVDDLHKQGWVFKKHLRLINPKVPTKYKRYRKDQA